MKHPHVRALQQSSTPQPHLAGHHGGGQGVEERSVAWGGVCHRQSVLEVGIHDEGGQAGAAGICSGSSSKGKEAT